MIKQIVKEFVTNNTFDKYVIAYSGGVDSQVLLHAFAAIIPEKVVAYHVNHGISSNAENWESFCRNTAESLGVEFKVSHFHLKDESNLEDKARVARYGAFASLVDNEKVALVTGHHLDDQAETFFLNLMRGSGLDGLSAMPMRKSFASGFHVRPFLGVSKEDLTEYAVLNDLEWVEDESNKDSTYDRNFIRNQVMPLLKTRWSHAASNIGSSIKHIQEAKEYVDSKVENFDYSSDKLKIENLVDLEQYEKIQVLRKWVYFNLGKSASQNMINYILNCILNAKDDAKMKWEQKNYFITRFNGTLYFVNKETKKIVLNDILKKGNIVVPDTASITVKKRVNGEKIKVKGDFHKEVKKIFQEMKIPVWERDEMLFVYFDDELVSVGGVINNPDYTRKN